MTKYSRTPYIAVLRTRESKCCMRYNRRITSGKRFLMQSDSPKDISDGLPCSDSNQELGEMAWRGDGSNA